MFRRFISFHWKLLWKLVYANEKKSDFLSDNYDFLKKKGKLYNQNCDNKV